MEKPNTDSVEEFLQSIKEGIMELRGGVCPMWQCGGELEYLEDRTNWQEPDLRCKNCGTTWLITKYNNVETEE